MVRRFRPLHAAADLWRPTLVALILVGTATSLLFLDLANLLPGYSSDEVITHAAASNLQNVLNNPLFLLNKLSALLLIHFNIFATAAARFISGLIGLAVIAAFYTMLSHWHTRRVALIATVMLACSSWFLGVARLGTTDSAFLLPVLLLLGGMWLQQKKHITLASLMTAGLAVVILYVPGMIWFVVPVMIWQRRRIIDTLKLQSVWIQSLTIVLAIIGVVPLVWGLAQEPSLVKPWLGLPAILPSPLQYLRNLLDIPLSLFVYSKQNLAYGLGNLPLIDVFTTVMAAFGVYAYAFRLKLDRTRLILAAMLLGSLLIALDGPVSVALLLPFVYALAAAGISLLLQKWFTVFPRNPLARGIALTIMIGAVAVSCFYHLNRYFVAWPSTPATKETFQHRI